MLAMECGTRGRVARRNNLLTGCGRFLLSNEDAESIVANIIATVRSEWDATLRRAGASENDCAAIASALLYEGFFYSAI
jgi:hypothetical protein